MKSPTYLLRLLLLAALFICAALTHAAPAKPFVFPRAFAPSEGWVKAPEMPLRQEMCLNGSWRFQPVAVPADWKRDQGRAPDLTPPVPDRWEKTALKVPSPWNVNAFNRDDGGDFRCFPSYPKAWDTAEMGWLERSFRVPQIWRGRRLILHFEAVAGDAEVFVNGKSVAHNFDLFLPFEADVTNAVTFGGVNTVRVGVRKASLFNDTRTTGSRPYPAGSFWGQAVAGIWQDVFLVAVPAVRAEETYVRPEVSRDTLTAEVTLRNDTARAETVQVGGSVQPWISLAGKDVLSAPEPRWHLGEAVLSLPPHSVTLTPGASATVTLSQKVGGRLRFWTPDAPNLYGLTVSVRQAGQTVDRQWTRFGWREFSFRGDRQLLNGKPFELRGDSWHFLGIPQMTRRYAWSWFTMLHAAHANAVRLHAQPYPRFYLDVADELGICVLDETANWGSDGQHKYDSPDFWRRCDDQVARLVRRDRNHPAVFGWSVSNEVAWFIDRGKHPEQIAQLRQGWADWRDIAHRLDPTRPWVSTDGDGDAEGEMPTSVGHYSGSDELARLGRGGKPWGIGETGGAYFATPKYAAQFIGPRAYESQQGRMEGIAVEAYGLIADQRKHGADYGCVFNLAWYGLVPLELGLTDTSRPYTLTDGVFFGPFRENAPGVQPERLGPYCSTFNPGYDPRLPLYRPWALFDAVKAANAPGGPAPSPWDHKVVLMKTPTPLPAPRIAQITVLAAPDSGSDVAATLGAMGATVAGEDRPLTPNSGGTGKDIAEAGPGSSPTPPELGAGGRADFIVIDGAHPPSLSPHDAAALARRVQGGATVLVWGVDPASLPALNALLPVPLQVTDRDASSLLVQSSDAILTGLDNGDFYFTESQPTSMIQHGLAGPFVLGGRTLLAACPAEWRRWNNRAEPVKTAALLRSEREAKPAGAALVEYKSGRGRTLVTSFVPTSRDGRTLWKRMLANAGVVLTERKAAPDVAFDEFGHLTQALVCGSFGAASASAAYDMDNIGIGPALHPKAGDQSSGLAWRARPADDDGVLDFKKMGLPGPMENAAVYLSFWVWSPRPLDNLLVEPNLPKLALRFGSDDGCQVWLNSKLLKEDRGTHPYTPDAFTADALPLARGWNHFVVKVVQGTGEWQFGARLTCSDPSFLAQLQTSVSDPIPGARAGDRKSERLTPMKPFLSLFLLLLALPAPAFAADRPAGVIGDGMADDTQAIQAALDAQGKTGGEVFLPPGVYHVAGSLHVPTGVTLRGSWDAPHHGAWDKGTTLAVTGGRGQEDGPAAVELAESSSIQGMTMVWPEQKWDAITAYPWAIHGQGMHNDVENVTFINAYQGIKIGIPWSELHTIRNVFGCVLRRGIFIDTTSDIGRIENVHFNEHYWARSHYPGITTGSDAPVTKFTEANLEAFIFGRTDWEYVLNTFVFGARIGYRFIHTQAGECNGQFMGIGADGCHVGVQIDAIQLIGIQITNGEFTTFTGEPNAGVVTAPGAGGAAQFVNCNFWSNPGGVAQLNGDTAVTFSDCRFSDTAATGAIVAQKGRLIVRGCQFAASGPAAVIGASVHAAIIAENTQPGGVQVQNGIGARAQIGLNELPFALPDAQAAHYRVKIGAPGDEDYVGPGWYGPERAADAPTQLRPTVTTARWAGAKSALRLPVLPGQAYTLTAWTSAPAGAPSRTFAVDGGPKAVVTQPGPQVVTLAIPARLTAGKHALVVTVGGPPWTPARLQPPSTDSRALTARVFAVEMTAMGMGGGRAADVN